MANQTTIDATLLFEQLPDLPEDGLRTDLRVLAGKHGLPVSGTSDVADRRLRLSCLPFEITIRMVDGPLPASEFSGAISANLRPGQRGPLAETVQRHAARVEIAVRDTGESHGVREAIVPTAQAGLQDARRSTIFAQDVVRMVMRHLPPLSIHWHPSNQLVLPGGLASVDFGRLYLPLCLRLRSTSAWLTDTNVVNLAQDVAGAKAFLGKPLHVMALSLNRFEAMQLAVAFLDRMLEGEARPIGGAIFRDQRGTRVQVNDIPPSEAMPDGLIALVEIGAADVPAKRSLSTDVQGSRDQVAGRVRARVRSRDLGKPKKIQRAAREGALNEAQVAFVKQAAEGAEPPKSDPADKAADSLPTADRLQELRTRAAANAIKGGS